MKAAAESLVSVLRALTGRAESAGTTATTNRMAGRVVGRVANRMAGRVAGRVAIWLVCAEIVVVY